MTKQKETSNTSEQLIDLVEKQNKLIEKQGKEIDRLKDSVRSKYDQTVAREEKPKRKPRGYVKRVLGDVIVKWLGKHESDIVKQNRTFKNPKTGMYEEVLKMDARSIEGKECVFDYKQLTECNDKEWFTISEDLGDDIIVEFDNPELAEKYPSFKINKKFINP
jgi:hypothetical protein